MNVESTKMETKEYHEKPAHVKWPIAPDGYIPNSVIRGWIQMLKQAKWDTEQEGDEEEFYIGLFDENYKGLRSQKRNRIEEKRSYVQWDYRPELDEKLDIHEDIKDNIDKGRGEVPSEKHKRKIWLKDDKQYDKNKDPLQSDGVKGKKDGRDRQGFDFGFERKRPEGITQKTISKDNKVVDADDTDQSSIERKNENTEGLIKDKEPNKELEVALKETTKDHKVQQSEASKKESVVKIPHTSIEDVQMKAADKVTQKVQSQLPTLDEKIDKKMVQPDPPIRTLQPENMNTVLQNANVDNKLQTTLTTDTVKAQKALTEVGPDESRQSSAGKTDTLISRQTPLLKSGPVASQAEMREAKSVEDVAKPPSKTHTHTEASQQPESTHKLETINESIEPVHEPSLVTTPKELPLVPPVQRPVSSILSADSQTPNKGYVEYTESRSLLSIHQTKSPQPEEPIPQTVVSKPSAARNQNAINVDQKVLGLYKKFKTGKWVSQKAPGKWPSTDIGKSSLKSKWSSSELEGLGTTESIHQHGSGEETTRSIGQTGLWKLIMEGVAESMDQEALWRLIKDRRTDFQSSGVDIGLLTEIVDESATRSQDSTKPTKSMHETGSAGVATGSTDNATLWDQIRDRPRPTEVLPQTGQAAVGPSALNREITTKTIDQDALRGRIRDRLTTQSFQPSSDGLDMGGSSRFLDETGFSRLSGIAAETIGQAAFHGLSGVAAETVGQAASRGLNKERHTDTMAHAVQRRQHPDAIRGEPTTESIVQSGMRHTGALTPTAQQSTVRTGPRTLDLTHTSQASLSQKLKPTMGPGLERSTDSSEELSVVRPLEPGGELEEETFSVETGPRLRSQDSFFKSMDHTSLRGWGTQGIEENIRQTGFGQEGVGGPTRSTTNTEASGQTASQSHVQTSRTNLSRSQDSSLFQGMQSMGKASSVIPTEFMAYPGYGRLDAHRRETPTSLSETGLRRSESLATTSPSEESTDRPAKFWTQTSPQGAERPPESTGHTGTWTSSDTAPQFDIQTSPGKPLEFDSMMQTASGLTDDESLSQTGPSEREGLGGSTVSLDHSGLSGKTTQASAQSIIGTDPSDKSGTSRSRDLLGLQTVEAMAHTPGLLSSSDPEQFLKALSQHKHTNKDNQKPMPKWRQKLYQLIFLYGFCSSQTAELLAEEQRAKPKTETEHEDRTVLLYEFLESIPSAVHERIVRKVQFQDILDQASSSDDDFNCMIPLPALNNFITWDTFGETEYGKLLFEWERGDEEEDQMKVVSKTVTM